MLRIVDVDWLNCLYSFPVSIQTELREVQNVSVFDRCSRII